MGRLRWRTGAIPPFEFTHFTPAMHPAQPSVIFSEEQSIGPTQPLGQA